MSVFAELSGYLRVPFYSGVFSSRQTTHDGIKLQLYVLGYRLGYIPILEAVIDLGNESRSGRMDCLFLDRSRNVVCGIEIDASYRKKSVAKLRALPWDAEKIIIAFGSNESWLAVMSDVSCYADIKVFRLCG
jgi:hypothetical protein